jgi:hypothetical protein
LDSTSNTARVLYPIADPSSRQRAVSYIAEGGTLRAVFPDGQTKWAVPLKGSNLFGGFDFDGDGWIDCGFIVRKPTGETRGSHTMKTTQLYLVRGKTGEILEVTEPLEDTWWPNLGYATEQWSQSSPLFGRGTPGFALAPYYAGHGFFYRYENGGFIKERYEYPSTPAYDVAYRNAKANAYGQSHSYIQNSHVGNGLLVKVHGQDRLLFFTSSRVVEYAVTAFGPEQLVCDHPFLNGNRADLAGRHYGLVALDPALNTRVTLVAGTSASSVYRDMKTGSKEADPWGAIERHVTIYDFVSDSLDHRFYSSAHDHGDGDKYQGRVVYPNGIYIPDKPGQPSRIAYNVYQDGQWHLHISKPGSTSDEVVLPDLFLWDIIDRRQHTELIISPAVRPREPDADSGYFPSWRTDVYAWHEPTRTLTPVDSVDGAIPHLLPAFREGDKTATGGSLFPVLRVYEDGEEKLLLERRDGSLFLEGGSGR